MQPRKAYKYGPPRGGSNDNLHAQSAYSFTADGFQNNLKGQQAKINGVYGKRSSSIATGVAPASGNDVMQMNNSKQALNNTAKKGDYQENEIMFVASN